MKNKNFLETVQSIYSGFTGPEGAILRVPTVNSINYCHVVEPKISDTMGNITVTTTDNLGGQLYDSLKEINGKGLTYPNSSSSQGWFQPTTVQKPMFHVLSFNFKKAEGHKINLAGVDKDRITVEVTQLEASAFAKVTVKADETSEYWPLGNEQSFYFSKEALFDKFTAEYEHGILIITAQKRVIPVVKPKVKTLDIK